MKSPLDMVIYFCTIQLEILKERELHLRKQIEDDRIQREFLSHILETVAEGEFDKDGMLITFTDYW